MRSVELERCGKAVASWGSHLVELKCHSCGSSQQPWMDVSVWLSVHQRPMLWDPLIPPPAPPPQWNASLIQLPSYVNSIYKLHIHSCIVSKLHYAFYHLLCKYLKWEVLYNQSFARSSRYGWKRRRWNSFCNLLFSQCILFSWHLIGIILFCPQSECGLRSVRSLG